MDSNIFSRRAVFKIVHCDRNKEQGEAFPNDNPSLHPELLMQTVNSVKPIQGPDSNQTTIPLQERSSYKHHIVQEYLETSNNISLIGRNDKQSSGNIGSKGTLPSSKLLPNSEKKAGPNTLRSNFTDPNREKIKPTGKNLNTSYWTNSRDYVHKDSAHVYNSASKNDNSFTNPRRETRAIHKKGQAVLIN